MPTHLSSAGLKAGDLLFWRGNTPFSRAIQRRTESDYSHVAIVMPTWDGLGTRQDCIEAVSIYGVRQVPLDQYLLDFPNQPVDWFSLDATARQRWAVVRYCRSRIRDRYASPRQFSRSFGWLGPLVRKLFRLPVDENDRRQFCSELVSAGLRDAGFEIPKEPPLMTPRDCAELPYVSFVSSICAG